MGTLSGKASFFVWACLCLSYHLEGEMPSLVLYSVTFSKRFLSTCIFSSLLPNRLAETLVYTFICNQYTSIYLFLSYSGIRKGALVIGNSVSYFVSPKIFFRICSNANQGGQPVKKETSKSSWSAIAFEPK